MKKSGQTDKKPLYSETDLLAMAKRSLNDLAEAIKAGKSERLLSYLSFVAKFPKYSHRNRALIEEQLPGASHVQGYRQWKNAGYRVAKGAVGIRILKPLIRKEQKEDANEEKEVLKGFIPVSVFDVSQLVPEDQTRVPKFFPTIYGDFDTLYDQLQVFARSRGYQVTETPYTQGAQGYNVAEDIYIKEDMTSGNKALTTIHEITHALLHWRGSAT